MLACVALVLRTAYEYFRLHADVPWVQFWWAITYYNAWFMVVNDDPLVWFYYNWGFTTLPDRRAHLVAPTGSAIRRHDRWRSPDRVRGPRLRSRDIGGVDR